MMPPLRDVRCQVAGEEWLTSVAFFSVLFLLCGSWLYELCGILSDDVAAGFFICRRTSFSGFRTNEKFTKKDVRKKH